MSTPETFEDAKAFKSALPAQVTPAMVDACLAANVEYWRAIDYPTKSGTVREAAECSLIAALGVAGELAVTLATQEPVRTALAELVAIIDAAGLANLANGVQLGQVSWYAKAAGALGSAREVLSTPPAQSAQPLCTGDPGECSFNGACMYRCGRVDPPAARLSEPAPLLTDEQIDAIRISFLRRNYPANKEDFYEYARAIERAVRRGA